MSRRRPRRALGAAERPMVSDSYQNLSARVGLGAGSIADGAGYNLNPITRMKVQLEYMYRGSWIVGAAVDSVAEDMTRAGVDFAATMDPSDIEIMQSACERLEIWQALCSTIKWARLYGGAAAIMLIDGQDMSTPLRPETIGKDAFKGLYVYDRWMLIPNQNDLVTDLGPELGRPSSYTINSDAAALRGQTVHHSRVLRFDGHELPYWQRLAEQGWGLSVIERLYDRLVAFDSTTQGAAQLVFKAHLRTLKKKGLNQILSAGGPGMSALAKNVDAIRQFQSTEGITLIDGDDEFETHSYSFSGLSDMMLQFGQQISGALFIPLVRLFGQSPAGLSSTGESDLRNYYDSISAQQEARLRGPMSRLLPVIYRSETGNDVPDDFGFTFNPLWQMSETEKAQIAMTTTAAVTQAYESGICDRVSALKELRQSAEVTGIWSNISDADIKDAESEEPPAPEGQHFSSGMFDGGFSESDHPRDDDGKFSVGSGATSGGETGAGNSTPSASEVSAIKKYTGADYRAINGHLVGGLEASEETLKTIAHLDNFLSRAKMEMPVTVYRGAGSLAVQELLGQAQGGLQKGREIVLSGYISTSQNIDVARKFVGISSSSMLLEIKMPKGSQAADISAYSDAGAGEKEVLVARNSRFKVLSFDGKSKRLTLEMLPMKTISKTTVDAGLSGQGPETYIEDDNRFVWSSGRGIIVTLGDDDGEVVLTLEQWNKLIEEK